MRYIHCNSFSSENSNPKATTPKDSRQKHPGIVKESERHIILDVEISLFKDLGSVNINLLISRWFFQP